MFADPHLAQCSCDAVPALQANIPPLASAEKAEGKRRRVRNDVMAFLLDRQLLNRANRAFMLGVVGGGLVACALGASIYDIGGWLDMW
jgi:hypothetical protein